MAGTLDDCTDIQMGIDGLEKWADRNITEFNRGEMQNSAPGGYNPMHQYSLAADCLENCSAEKALGILVDTKLTMNKQCEGQQPPGLH